MRLDRHQLKALFQKDPTSGKVTYIGEKELKVTINKRYETFAALAVEQDVTTLGCFDISIDDEHYGYIFPCMVTMSPSLIEEESNGTEKEMVLTFLKGDAFLKSSTAIKRADLVFAIFKTFVFFGIRYKFMTENNISRLFDHVHLTGFNMTFTYSSIISAMNTELCRNPKQIDLLNRLSDQKEPGVWFGMKNVTLTAKTLMTKLSGSYLRDNITRALVTTNTNSSELENLLRK